MSHSKNEPKLGELIDSNDTTALRDAVHIAITPAIASQRLNPGQIVTFTDKEKDTIHMSATFLLNPIGIVDPYLRNPILTGQRFWVFLFPRTVTSLRHQWTHPEFDEDKILTATKDELDLMKITESVNWLKAFAQREGKDYDFMLKLGKNILNNESTWVGDEGNVDTFTDNKELILKHLSIVLQKQLPKADNVYFTCAY